MNPRRREFYELRRLGAEPLSPCTGESLTNGREASRYLTEDRDICLYRDTGFSLKPLPALWDLLDSDKKFQNVLELEIRQEHSYTSYLEVTDEVFEQEVRSWLDESADTLVRGEDIPQEPDYSLLDNKNY